MGNSASTAAPTRSSAARDSDYVLDAQQRNESLDETKLVLSYMPVYEDYLKRMRMSIVNERFTFKGEVRNGNGTPVTVLTIDARLRTSAINKILNQMCKMGRLHDDICVVLTASVEIPNEAVPCLRRHLSLKRDGKRGLPRFIECTARMSAFQVGWGIMHTHNLEVDVDMCDLTGLRLSSEYEDIERAFSMRSSRTSRKFHNRECCICLEVLDKNHKSIHSMRCGHSLHMECYQQLLVQSHLCCPYCRTPL